MDQFLGPISWARRCCQLPLWIRPHGPDWGRVEGGAQLVAVAEKIVQEILYLLFFASSVSMNWLRQEHSTPARSYKQRARWDCPKVLRPIHPFPNGNSRQLWTQQKQQRRKFWGRVNLGGRSCITKHMV